MEHKINIAQLSLSQSLASPQTPEPVRQPNGARILAPFPLSSEVAEVHQEIMEPVSWPRSSIPQLQKTKSFISLATHFKPPTELQQHFFELDYLQMILQASTRVYDLAIETPLQLAKNLSIKVKRNNQVYLKREDLQPVCYSFKIRGAYNKISQLSTEERRRGVICMSAGNHAQGVALAAQKLKIQATIVMPLNASEIKIQNVRRLGATVVLYGQDLEEAKKECLRIAEERNFVFIPPFDDPFIIAGQGTCGMEILKQMRHVDAVFVPVGGGGLLSGIAAYIKRVKPDCRIIGVNTLDSSGMFTSLSQQQKISLATVGVFADGTAIRTIGDETFRLCSQLVDDMVLVTTDEICAAIKDVFEDTRTVLEPAGAQAVAGIKKYLNENQQIKNGKFAVVTSGANMNFSRLRFVCERSRIGEGRECLLSCRIDEQPGAFMKLHDKIYPRSVTEVSYRYCDPLEAHIYMAFEVDHKKEMEEVLAEINLDSKMSVYDITENDLAKSHLRFLVGGRASSLQNEKLFRFTFPERPGELKKFLDKLSFGEQRNLTLVHYRNTGGDVAKVLIGLVVEPNEEPQFMEHLNKMGYAFIDETKNPVYKHFLH